MTERIDLGRRGLLRGALFTREGREQHRRQQQPLGPAPPGLQAVQDICPACAGNCLGACPQHIISLHPAGHPLAGRPYLDFSSAGCLFCGDCAAACPQDGGRIGTDALPALGTISLDKGSCLSWNGVVCMSCQGGCEQQALSFDTRRRLSVAAARCNGCGACVALCPSRALSVDLLPVS